MRIYLIHDEQIKVIGIPRGGNLFDIATSMDVRAAGDDTLAVAITSLTRQTSSKDSSAADQNI